MKNSDQPLEYPPDYPPIHWWRKFLCGIPWLGTDFYVLKHLKRQQGARTNKCMMAWGSSERAELATIFGHAFKKWLRWPTPYFLPADRFRVIAGGPTFRMVDSFELEGAIREVEKNLGKRFHDSFWEESLNEVLGEVLDEILKRKDTV